MSISSYNLTGFHRINSHLKTHFAATRELEGVAQEIDNDLPQTARVTDQLLRNLRADIGGKFQTLLVSAQG